MKKKTKLKEKASRVPDIREKKIADALEKYLKEVEPLNAEAARSMRFGIFLNDVLCVQTHFIESFVSGVEKYLKSKQTDRILKGRADNLFGNVIIEFESHIPKHQKLAEEQLQRYTAILWSNEKPASRAPYLCIATDGVRFLCYSPALKDATLKEVAPENVVLNLIEDADWTKQKAVDVYLWLDRYFLRKEILPPTTEAIVRDFGINSHAFQTLNHALLTQWDAIKEKSTYAVIYESWEKYLRIVYGSDIGADELFVRHTYLATLAKLMTWMRITGSASLPEDAQLIEILEGEFFKSQGIENFIEEDFFSWLARGEAVKTAVSVSRMFFSLLQKYNLRELSEDVMKSLYQELVDPETRHDLGEFYTPDWLAHRMVNKILDKNPRSSVLDPACGSGTFLYLTIQEKRARLGDTADALKHILSDVCGADIHPLAVIVAKTNYILALGDLIKKRKGNITIPIYLADTMKLPPRWIPTQETSDYVIESFGKNS